MIDYQGPVKQRNGDLQVELGRTIDDPDGADNLMLRLALFFLVVSIVAAIFGFGGVAAASADIARILFFIAIVIFVVLLVAGLMAGSTLW